MKPLSPITLSEHLYRRLLILYPSRFRSDYAREMMLVFRSQRQDFIQRYGQGALVHLWASTLTDLVATALTERMKEGISMSKVMWVQLSGIIAFLGGLLGMYLLTQGQNEYGNYGWHSELAPVAAILLAVGLAGWFTAYYEQMDSRAWLGLVISVGGLLGMAIGYLVEAVWFLIFVGPIILVPIGAILLGISSSRTVSLPAWWRYFPFVVAIIGVLGFGIEMWEEMMQNSASEGGLTTAQLLFSVVWLGLGIGLLVASRRSTSEPGVM